MRFVKQRSLPITLTHLKFVVSFLTLGLLTTFSSLAQTIPVGKHLYEKLRKTQQEYNQAMVRGDSLEVAEMCYLLGKRYSALGDFRTAQKWFVRSLRIREPLGKSDDIGKVYLRMAENQVIQRHFPDALAYTRHAMDNFQHVHSQHGMMGAYNVLAGIYELGWRMNQEKPGTAPVVLFDSAQYYLRRAEQLAITLKKPSDIANIFTAIGGTLAWRNPDEAILYLKKAYTINAREKYPYGIINTSQKLADCYLALERPKLAEKWLQTAQYVRDTARQGDFWQNSDREAIYVRLYQQTGKWKQALEHQKKYDSFLIEAVNADREGAIARAGMFYESEKKEAQLRAQRKELTLRQDNLDTERKLSLMTTVLMVLAGIACVIFYWLFRKYRRISVHNAKLIKEQNHRVKNNLQSITSLLGLQFNRLTDPVARQAVEESLLRVEAMALVHQRLYDGDKLVEVDVRQFVPELVGGALRTYSLGHIQPIYTLSPLWIHADVAINLGLLLNELVTNTCKYAFPDHPNPILEIGCQELNGRIQVWFKDNGPGFKFVVKGNSFGMKLIDIITEKLKGKSSFQTENGCYFFLSFDPQPSTALN